MAKLQADASRKASRLTREDAQIGGSLEIGVVTVGNGVGDTSSTDAYLKLPGLTTTQRLALTGEVGMVVFDTTLGEEYTYRDVGWGSSSGSAAGSLDAAYNGGATITVDAGAVTLTDTQTTTGGGLLITKSGVITGANSASVFHINSTGAHDTSGDVKFLEISVGSETISGSVYGIEIAMNANTDSGITVTKGAVTLSDGAFTMTSGAFLMTSGNFTMSSGNADITGTLTVSGTSALQAVTTSSSITSEGVVIVDVDNAEALLIRENSDAADVLTVDTTQDAGDTTMLLTTKVTTGTGSHVDGSTVTTGDALKVTVAAATMTAAGAAISAVADGTEVFAVRDDGSVYIKGTAEGTTALQLLTGDAVITDGDLVVTAGEVAFTSTSTTAGLVVVNNTFTTGTSMVDVSSTSISTGALMRLNANTTAHDGEVLEIISAGDAGSTPKGVSITMSALATGAGMGIWVDLPEATTGAKGISVRMDKITTGDMLYLDNGGASMTEGTGTFINCNDDDTSQFQVGRYGETTIAGKAAGTAALTLDLGDVVLTDTDSTTVTSVNGTGSIVEIISGGAIGADKACLEIDAAGTFNADGSLLRLSAENITATNDPFAMQIDAAALDMSAINIVCAPATLSAVVATTTGALAADKAVVELVSNAAACNADSAVLRLEQTATDGVAYCLNLKQDDTSQPFLNFEGTSAAGTATSISSHGTPGATTDFVQIFLNGVKAWVAVSTNNPSA